MNTINHVKWLGEYTMEDFVVEFGKRTPLLMKTLTGTLGWDEIHIISGDEVYWIKSLKRQKRIVTAMENQRGFLSIPVNYPIQFELYIDTNVSKKTRDGKPLSEIMDKIDLSSGKKHFIRAVKNEKLFFQIGSDAGNKARFGFLEIIDTYDEKYLIGHPICNNQIHSSVFAIPVYLNIELTVAVSFVNHLQECFDNWFEQIQDIASTYHEGELKICEEIIMFDKCPNNGAYEYIDPRTFNMSKKSKAALEDYSRESNPYHIGGSSPDKNKQLSKQSSFILPPIPRRAPPPLPKQTEPEIVKIYPEAEKQEIKIPVNHLPLKSLETHYESPRTNTNEAQKYEIIFSSVATFNKPPNSIDVISDSAKVEQKHNSRLESDENVSMTSYHVSPNADVSKFTVRDVQRCLNLLHLEKHSELFKELQVDGELLQAMKEEMLVNECNFSKFEAMKLLKFVKHGWRPNL